MTLESSQSAAAAPRVTGNIVAIHLNPGPRARAPLRAVENVTAREGGGLEGDDRHARSSRGRQVLLAEHEVLERFGLAPGAVREQVTVRGLALDTLAAGTRLRVGTALFEVDGLCEPCERMNELKAGLREELDGQRGRFVHVIEGGTFAIGDPIRLEPPRA